MSTIEEKQKRLEQQRARLVQKAQKLKSEARKIETRRMIRLGELVKKAGLADLDEDVLLGGLLELKELSIQETSDERWRQRCSLYSPDSDSEALIVSFASPPHKEISKKLRDAGLKWNSFRNEWQGFASLVEIEKIVVNLQAKIQRIQ